MFSSIDKQYILDLARQAIEVFLQTKKKIVVEEKSVPLALIRQHACFVTLTKDFELRGCVGHLEAIQPLYSDIIENAIAAATQDDRFNPVTLNELSDITIEVSVLSEPQFLTRTDVGAENFLPLLRVGVDGVILKKGEHSATFLPQVWDELLDKKEFLAALCVKAGLPPSAWMEAGVEIQTYQVEIVSE